MDKEESESGAQEKFQLDAHSKWSKRGQPYSAVVQSQASSLQAYDEQKRSEIRKRKLQI